MPGGTVAAVRLLEMKSDGHLATQCRVNWLPRFPCAPQPPTIKTGASTNNVCVKSIYDIIDHGHKKYFYVFFQRPVILVYRGRTVLV